MEINNNKEVNKEKGLVMITRTNWPAVVGLCFTLSVGWYSLAIVPLQNTIEKQGIQIEQIKENLTSIQVTQGMNSVTLKSFKESIDRLNTTLGKLEERIR